MLLISSFIFGGVVWAAATAPKVGNASNNDKNLRLIALLLAWQPAANDDGLPVEYTPIRSLEWHVERRYVLRSTPRRFIRRKGVPYDA
jgi:hypothetical protein